LARRFFSSFPVRGGDAGQTVDPFDQKDITGVSIAEKPKQLGTREHGIAIPGGDRQAAFGGESRQLATSAVDVLGKSGPKVSSDGKNICSQKFNLSGSWIVKLLAFYEKLAVFEQLRPSAVNPRFSHAGQRRI
jgi:hypothetical protein